LKPSSRWSVVEMPGPDVGDVDLALAADRLGHGAGRDPAALDVVGGDVADREVGVAGARLVLAVADEGVDRDHRDAGVMRAPQRLDQLGGVGGGDQDGVGPAGDHGIEHRHLQHRLEFLRPLEVDGDAQRLGGGLGSPVHGDVEIVGGQARDQRDLDVGLCGCRCRGGEGQGHGPGGRQMTKLHVVASLVERRALPAVRSAAGD
jgi:hypothetical protein